MTKNDSTWRVRAGVRLGAGVIALGALAAGALVASASAAPAPPSPRTALTVATIGGTLRGTTAGRTDEFLGIPYAAPPVGPLRWQPPQPAAPWTGGAA